MALDKKDSSKIGYKAKIEWLRERKVALAQGFVNQSVIDTAEPNADEYLKKMSGVSAKIAKLNARIDYESSGLRIPVDKVSDASVYDAVVALDPSSGGEYITYELYTKVLERKNAGIQNLKVEDIIANSGNDPKSNSQYIQDKIYSGYDSFSSVTDNGNVKTLVDKMVIWGDVDLQANQLINFVDKHLGTTTDPVYIPWSFKRDMAFESTQNSGYDKLWSSYSPSASKQLQNFGGKVAGMVSLRPDSNVAGVTDRYLDYTNKFLNELNDLLNDKFSLDLICCFLKFSTKLDTKTLRGIRTLIGMFRMFMNLDFEDLKNVFKDIFNNIMRGLILNQLLGLINQIIQRIADPIRKWLDSQHSGTMGKLLECVPIRDLIEKYLQDAIDKARKFFADLLLEIYKDLEMQKIYKDSKLAQAWENKSLSQIMDLLDVVIRVMELAAQCSTTGTPKQEDAQKLIDKYELDNKSKYEYPAEKSPDVYNSFITPEQQLAIEDAASSGDTLAVDRIINQTSSNRDAEISKRLDDCRRNVTVDDMPTPVVWLEELIQQSQGRV